MILRERAPETTWLKDRDRGRSAEAVDRGDQSQTINQLMAAVAASHVENLPEGACGWMSTHIDLDNCVLRSAPIESRHVCPITASSPRSVSAAAPRVLRQEK